MSAARVATARKVAAVAQPTTAQKLLAEFLGTAFLTAIGAGAVTATNTLTGGHPTYSDVGIIALAHAIALGISIYAVGKISGCHINPAVTVGMWASRRITSSLAGMYIVAQMLGAVAGALGIIVLYGPFAAHVHGGMGVTAFSAPTNPIQAAAAEAIGAFIFLFVITAMAADPRSPTGWAGLIIGLTLGGVIMMLGPVTGASLNPARSFGPALIQTFFGGKVAWSQYWVYVVGPIVGAVAGVFAYDYVADNQRKGA